MWWNNKNRNIKASGFSQLAWSSKMSKIGESWVMRDNFYIWKSYTIFNSWIFISFTIFFSSIWKSLSVMLQQFSFSKSWIILFHCLTRNGDNANSNRDQEHSKYKKKIIFRNSLAQEWSFYLSELIQWYHPRADT